MSNNYVVYHLHSDLSNGITNIDSVTKYKEYVDYAASLGMKAMGFSEHGCIFEWVHKKQAIEAAGMKYIHAAEVYLTEDKDVDDKHRDNYHCVLIAKNYDGVKELNKMISKSFCRNDHHFYYVPRITFEELFATSDNIIVTTACFLPGTKVKTIDGYKNIEDITRNDFVMNMYGEFEKVNFPTQRQYNGNGYEIELSRTKNIIRCTENHKFLVMSNNNKNIRWEEAKNIAVDKSQSSKEFMLLPINTSYSGNFIIKKELWKDSYIVPTRKLKNVIGDIKLTNEFMRMIGMFIGDGCISLKKNPRISFTLNYNEYHNHYHVIFDAIENQLDIKFSITKRKEHNRVDITSSNVDLINLFYWLFGDVKSHTKYIPSILMHVSKEFDMELLYGMMLTDGSIGTTVKDSYYSGRFTYVTSSNKLFEDVKEIMDSLYISYGTNLLSEKTDKNGVHHCAAYRIESNSKEYLNVNKNNLVNHNDIVRIINNISLNHNKYFVKHNGCIYKKMYIKSINKIQIKETVYCLNNNTHSFVCENVVAHNCVGGVLGKGDDETKKRFVKFLIANKDRCYLEVQHHNTHKQSEYNKMIYTLSKKTGINMVAATDTHCLNEKHVEGRKILQRAKNVYFSDEDGWDLTFKTYDELVAAFKKQDALPEEAFMCAIENTNVIADSIGTFELDYSHKYPKLYDDSEGVLKEKIKEGIIKRGVNKYDNFDEYKNKIKYELETYKHNGAIDFLLLEEDYKSALKKQGVSFGYSRGSVSGSVIAYLLGITEVDSIKYNLNFERFMNKERVSLADVDTDWYKGDRYKVREYLFNKEGLYCCDIVTFNTIALKGAIKDVGRAFGLSPDETQTISNAVYKDDNKKDVIDDFYIKKYQDLFKYVDIVMGTIVSIGNHPAGLVVSPYPVDEWFGLCSTATNANMISQINMKEIDGLNFVKLDVLGLDCVGLINMTCDLAGIPRITPDNISFDDDKVWDEIKEDTTLIFQFESPFASKYLGRVLSDETISKVKKENPNFSRIDLMSMANAALRPAGESYREELAQGIYRDNGHEALNNFLAPTLGYLVYQEQIIEFLHSFCGYTMGEADIVRRGFAKKTGTEKFIPKIKSGFIKTMKEKYDVDEDEANHLIENFLKVIKSASLYAFSNNHATPYSFIGYVVGYLRYYYKLETVTTALNIYQEDDDKSLEIIGYAKRNGIEIKPIKFGKSGADYTMDKPTNSIYKGIASIKYCNAKIAGELMELSKNKYKSFIDLLKDIEDKTSVNSRQLAILISLNFFEQFGKNKKLFQMVDIYNKFANAKVISKKKIDELGLSEYLMKKYSEKETASQYRNIDNHGLVMELCNRIEDASLNIVDQIKAEHEYLGYVDYVNPKFSNDYYAIVSFETFKDARRPNVVIRRICDGEELSGRIKNVKVFEERPFGLFSILKIDYLTYEFKKKKVGDKWVSSDETELILKEYEVIK